MKEVFAVYEQTSNDKPVETVRYFPTYNQADQLRDDLEIHNQDDDISYGVVPVPLDNELRVAHWLNAALLNQLPFDTTEPII